MEKLVLWEVNPAWLAKEPENRLKVQMMMLEWVQAEVKAKQHKAWGITLNGMSGYALTDIAEKDIFMMLAKYEPVIEFKVKSMLNIEEAIDCTKKLAEQMKQ